MLAKIHNEAEAESWKYGNGNKVSYNRNFEVLDEIWYSNKNSCEKMFFEKFRLQNIDALYEKLQNLKFRDVQRLNLYEIEDKPSDNESVWLWSRASHIDL